MGMFTMRKPRGFHHSYIYVDERKEKLDKMKENAKRELGMLTEKKRIQSRRYSWKIHRRNYSPETS